MTSRVGLQEQGYAMFTVTLEPPSLKALCGPESAGCYLGLTDGSPPGVPGGGMTGIRAPEGGGVRFIPGSTLSGGVITPPERPRSELLPFAGGTTGVLGWSAFGRPPRSSAETAAAIKPTTAAARTHILRISASALSSSRCPDLGQTP
jgi:hypothetical protein